MMRHFDPCVATADMFLYAQGNSIVCCHHDTLTIERRFSRHPDEVLLLAVDNQSERGAGRLVVSYDASQNAIVWDIMSGNEIARFASFSNLTAVAWMRNGAVAFGNDSGTIILFEPETSEHVSFRTIDQIAVTALAPATDCRTFAIGYQNGSILICNLQPRFTILHNLTTSRGPSPIVGLSWHASSTRQRSDMLAVQTYDGDLRVWSVAKSHNGVEPAKVVRILKRTDNYFPGPNWMNWSKNGRIIQFSEGETLSWDVRTKHVTYDSIPTLEHVRGLAVYGPGASLFTLGANNTVQQFDLNAPAVLVADVQHPANLLPPSPPVSVEEQEKQEAAAAAAAAAASSAIETDSSVATTSESEISIHLDGGVSESDDDYQSPLARLVNAGHIVDDTESDIARTVSATSSAVSHISEDKSETSSKTPGQYAGSVRSRGMTEYTYMSIGSSLKSSIHPNNMYQQPQHHQQQQQQQHSHRKTPNPQRQSVATYSTATSTTFSTTSSRTGMSRPSRLRNEVPRSPDDAKVLDLFKFTRSRLSDVPYRMPPAPANGARLTNDDLRRQMLYTIFGWTEDIGDLVRDEMDRYPAGSANRILLAKWLGDIDPDIMKASSETMTSSDWMLLALSGIGSQASQHKLGRAYTQRLLESGDVHAAATIMIGMGDCNDAIEIYASHHKYMEALIVAALFYPSVWERQSHLIKKWGEWAIKNGRRELAIRCAACTGKESSEPWTSPSAAQINFPSINSALPELNSPPLSPPSLMQRGPQRSIAKSSALRLITNFSDATSNTRAQIFASDADGATPIAAGVTPIVESAISPGHNDATTAFLRPSQRSVFNTPSSARPAGGGFGRQRLPSIGEGPQGSQDANHPRNILKGVSDALGLQSQPAEGIDAVAAQAPAPAPAPVPQMTQVDNGHNLSIGMALQRASTSSPLYRRKEQPPPSPSPASLAMLMDGRHSRNGPRNRIPVGVDLQLAPVAPETIMDMTSPEQTGASSNRYRWPSRRRGPASVSSSVTSNSSVGHSLRSSRFRTGDAPNTSKTLDEYINSLEVVNAKAARSSSKDRHQRSRDIGRQRRPSVATPSTSSVSTVTSHSREASSNTDVREWVQTRSRAGSKTGGKRSPRSPVPMSPEDLISLASTPRMFARDVPAVDNDDMASLTAKKTISTSSAAPPPVSMQPLRPSSKSRPTSRASSRGRSTRNRSPDRQPLTLDIPRGRNSSRTASAIRSPSSPLPFSNNAAQYRDSDDEEDYQRAVEAQEKFRNRDRTSQRGRSSSQGRRDASPGSVRARERSRSRRRPTPDVTSTAAPAATSRKERALAGPPPAPSAMAVAAGGFDRYPASQQSLGEELGRRRTQSAMTNRGDLRQLSKDERAQRKAAAARELEERRKSLVRHPNAPPIMHPDYLSPGLNQSFGQISEAPELSSDVYSRHPNDLPMRSQSTDPVAMQSSSSTRTRSMFAPRGHQSIGLPATPKAMRLVLEPGAGAGSSTPPSVPPIPAAYGHQRTSSGSAGGRSSPETKPSPKRNAEPAPAPLTLSATTYSLRSEVPPAPKTSVPTKSSEPTLTLLPSTVYQPPSMSRAAIPRSMSAPPQELVYNKDFSASRKASREKNPTIPESSNDDNDLAGTLSPTIYRRPSLDNMIPPPPPPLPAPPMLKELAHLAVPPPPPPAPLPFGSSMNKPVVYGGHTTGTIEVVMDDGEVQPVVTISPQNTGNNGNNGNAPQYANYPPPPPPPPAPPIAQENLSQSRNGHQRGRSSTDNSIAGRISRATERMRSASRGPNAASRTKSPEITMVPYESIQIPQSQSMGYAPYESVPPPQSSFASCNSPPQQTQMQFQPQQQLTQQQLAQQQLQLQQIEYQNQMRTGLHQSEMI
ncbi:hypothetical protein Sste5346_001830 [Sporothrix stenoceras]|uniref:Gem-associated protein 5 TPR domain-containing protein n=1 Tax=Sporothrix stenoceras TaxID=5173 RepID=A0ABR3ZMX6_9PEZI